MNTLFGAEEPMPRLAGENAVRTREWLNEMGLADCNDPNAMILLEAAIDLDELNSGLHQLSHKDLVTARGRVRHNITTARRSLQPVIDEHSLEREDGRHRLRYSGVAARTMGWIDPGLLTPELLELCADHLAAEHGIKIADYEPRTEAL